MTATFQIPVIPVSQLQHHHSSSHRRRLLERLGHLFSDVVLRDAPAQDAARWHEHEIGGRSYRFARPLTLTPYASARACSARCRFCSETLRDGTASSTMPASLRPSHRYADSLREALKALEGVPLSYSLSGLEATDDPHWLLSLLDTLASCTSGPVVEGSVLYTNGAGLVAHPQLLGALKAFKLSWMEWSRHHDQEAPNQRIMRFRPGQQVQAQTVFEEGVIAVQRDVPVKLVCVVQRGGIETVDDVLRYLGWAGSLGVRAVIFRAFSELPAHYVHNATRRYIDSARVAMNTLQQACIEDPRFMARHVPVALTSGYYFWNARWATEDGCEVVFESSDYEAMLAREASGLIYKLVFHANEHLCAGWQPDRNVLWRPQ